MSPDWSFDAPGPDASILSGPIPLATRQMGLPGGPGLYLITCGGCLAHVGTSNGLSGRVGSLARLGTHRGSNEVLCAAYCSRNPPLVWWATTQDVPWAKRLEKSFKLHYGEPPAPRGAYEGCVNGRRLMEDLIEVAGEDSWEAGYVEAVFTIGEKLVLLFQPRLQRIWQEVGVPPGPWPRLPT